MIKHLSDNCSGLLHFLTTVFVYLCACANKTLPIGKQTGLMMGKHAKQLTKNPLIACTMALRLQIKLVHRFGPG